MEDKTDFQDELIDFLTELELFDDDEVETLSIERSGKEIDFAVVAPMSPSEISLVSGLVNTGRDIFVTITDGPANDLALFMEWLEQRPKSQHTGWGDVLEVKSSLLQQNGVAGVFFSRLRYHEFFDEYPDSFDYQGVEYPIKAVLFLSQQEVDAFGRDEDEFYDLIGEKDPILFKQN